MGWFFGMCMQLLSKVGSFVGRGRDTSKMPYIKQFYCAYINPMTSTASSKLPDLQGALKSHAGQYVHCTMWGSKYMQARCRQAIIVDFTLNDLVLTFDYNFLWVVRVWLAWNRTIKPCARARNFPKILCVCRLAQHKYLHAWRTCSNMKLVPQASHSYH